jgi:hypothetical protein
MSNVNLDALLDSNLDDLADLPEFGCFPNGTHKVTMKLEPKEVNSKSCIELSMTLIETVEQSDPAAEPCKPGFSGNVLFMLDNEFGQGKLKKFLKPLASHFGVTNFREISERLAGEEFTVVTKTTQNKDKSQTYNSVEKILI